MSKPKRQLLYVWNYRDWGGAQIYFMSLMKEAKRSYDVSALIPTNSEPRVLQYLESIGVPVEFLPPTPSDDGEGGLIAWLNRRVKILRSEAKLTNTILARDGLQETIVHADLGFWQSFLPSFRLCRRTNVFMTVHTALQAYSGWRAWRWRIKGKILSRFSNFHLLASNYDAKQSLELYITQDKFHDVEVTYSGIDLEEIGRATKNAPSKLEVLTRYGLPENTPLIMTVGQFIERKGCWVLLESLNKLRSEGKDFQFMWLSTTAPSEETRARIDEYGLRKSFRVMHAEEIGETRLDLLTLLSIADIFVLASLQEGLPIALVEAMALDLPCVATNVNAIPEAIESDRNGILVPPGDPGALAHAVTALLNDPQQREPLGRAARETALAKFNAKATAHRTLELYDEVWKTTA